jgi:hypothetical protein
LLTAQFVEFAPQRFDFRHPIQPQQDTQLTGLMSAQAQWHCFSDSG